MPATWLLPLLPLVSFVVLSIAAGVASEREASLLAFCGHCGIDSACVSRVQLLQALAAAWIVSAAAIGVLIGFERAAARRSRPTPIPSRARLAYAVFLAGIGAAGLFAAEAQGYGRVPQGIAEALLYTYLTGSLFLFASTFLGYRPRPDAVARAAVFTGTAHGVLGMILTATYAYFLAFPPIVAT